MGKDTIIILNDGTAVRFTPKAVKFIDELEKFFDDRGIPKEDIPIYLIELARRERENIINPD